MPGFPRLVQCVHSPWRLSILRGLACASLWFWAASLAHADTYCAHDSFGLTSALAEVSDGGVANGRNNVIHVVAGDFSAPPGGFSFLTTKSFALVLDGGYDVTCASQSLAIGATTLDGNMASQVLSAQTRGSLIISHLTFQHGSHNGSAGGGLQISLAGPEAAARFDANVVRDNVTGYAAAGMTIFSDSASEIHLDNNLFLNNSGPASGALATGMADGSTVYLTNNTFSGNSVSNTDSIIVALGGAAATFYISNNISYANVGPGMLADYYLYGFQNSTFLNNDLGYVKGEQAPGSANNVTSIDPQFVGADDFHLAATSPVQGIGIVAAPGGLPTSDIEGHARTFANLVDLGAFQHGDGIFADGFNP